MPWVRFVAAFDYRVRHNVVIAYRAWHEVLVKADCAEQAIRLGRAVAIERPRKANENASSDPIK